MALYYYISALRFEDNWFVGWKSTDTCCQDDQRSQKLFARLWKISRGRCVIFSKAFNASWYGQRARRVLEMGQSNSHWRHRPLHGKYINDYITYYNLANDTCQFRSRVFMKVSWEFSKLAIETSCCQRLVWSTTAQSSQWRPSRTKNCHWSWSKESVWLSCRLVLPSGVTSNEAAHYCKTWLTLKIPLKIKYVPARFILEISRAFSFFFRFCSPQNFNRKKMTKKTTTFPIKSKQSLSCCWPA